MTRDEIMNMPAGREMDALVDEKVFGSVWDEKRCRICGWPIVDSAEKGCTLGSCSMRPIPKRRADEHSSFSIDVSAAWQVVEKMQEDGDVFIEWWNDREWFVANKPVGVRNDAITAHCDGRATGTPSAPLAICRAALLAVMESEE